MGIPTRSANADRLVTVLSGEIDMTNLAVNKLQNNLQHTQLSAKAQAALKNIVPLILDKEIKEPLDLIAFGYKIQFFNNGNGIIIGAPNTTNPSDNPTPLYGRIYVYEFINSNWYITNTITEDDLELYGYGRYVSCSNDGKLISQCNWAAETEYKGTLLKAYANPDGITANFPLSYYQGYTVSPDPIANPGEYYTVTGIDGTYAIDPEDGGSGYGDTVIVNFSTEMTWLQQYFGAAVSATTENGKVVSVTISGVDGINYFENTTKTPDLTYLANGNLLQFNSPPPVYENIFTFTGAYEAKLSGDGSTIAVVRYPTPGSSFNFYIYDISGETVTEKLMEPGLLTRGSEGIWFAIDMTHDGSRIIVNLNGSSSSPYVFIKQLDGTFTKSTLATPTNHVKYNSLTNIELTSDGNHLIVGDRQSWKVDYYKYNNTNTSYEYVNSITSSHGNFGGGHSGIAISPNGKYIAIGARKTALVGDTFWGAAYLYRKNVNGEWNKVATIPRNYESSNMFGNSIDMTNYKIIVSTLNLSGISNPGHVDIYTITEDLDEYGLTAIRESINENKQEIDDHAIFLDNSVVSKYQVRNLTSAFTEFKSVEFSLPIAPAPDDSLFTPTTTNKSYIKVTDSELLTTNALVSMYNKGVIRNSWTETPVYESNDNGFVKVVDKEIVGNDNLSPSHKYSPRHLMCARPSSNFNLSLSFSITDLQTYNEFFIYDLSANTDPTNGGPAFYGKYLDISSILSSNSVVCKDIDDLSSVVPLSQIDISNDVFYNLSIYKLENNIYFTLTDEDGNTLGSGKDSTVNSDSIYWGLFNNDNITIKNIVNGEKLRYFGNGTSQREGSYKIQSGLNNNRVISNYFLSVGSTWDMMEISGDLIQSEIRSQNGAGADFQTTDNLDFVFSNTDQGQCVLYDVNGLRGLDFGGLFTPAEYDLTTRLNEIAEEVSSAARVQIESVNSYTDNSTTIVGLHGYIIEAINGLNTPLNTVYIKFTIDNTTGDLTFTENISDITLPNNYYWNAQINQRLLIQPPRNNIEQDDINLLITRDTFFGVLTGMKRNNTTDQDETNLFILKDNELIATIPIKDKYDIEPIKRTYTDDTSTYDYNELILLGSQLVESSDALYLYVCYGVDTKGAPFNPPANKIIRSNTYQKLARINLTNIITNETTLPEELNISNPNINYFSEDPEKFRNPKNYISPISSYPYGQHINITSNAMIAINRQPYFENSLYLYELDLANLTFKNKVIYESRVDESIVKFTKATPFRGTINKNYCFISAPNTAVIDLKESFEKGSNVSVFDKLDPVVYLKAAVDVGLSEIDVVRTSTLAELPVSYWDGFDSVMSWSELNNPPTSLDNVYPIQTTVNGGLIFNSETYQFAPSLRQYISTTNPDNYFTVSEETGNPLPYNSLITIPGAFKIMEASESLGGDKWIPFILPNPPWEYKRWALSISENAKYKNYWIGDLSIEEPVPNSPDLVYLSFPLTIYLTLYSWGKSNALSVGGNFGLLVDLSEE